jgi:hypothetical protein
MNAFKRDKVTVDSGARQEHCRSNKLRSADISVVPAEDQEIKATCDDQMGLCRTDIIPPPVDTHNLPQRFRVVEMTFPHRQCGNKLFRARKEEQKLFHKQQQQHCFQNSSLSLLSVFVFIQM